MCCTNEFLKGTRILSENPRKLFLVLWNFKRLSTLHDVCYFQVVALCFLSSLTLNGDTVLLLHRHSCCRYNFSSLYCYTFIPFIIIPDYPVETLWPVTKAISVFFLFFTGNRYEISYTDHAFSHRLQHSLSFSILPYPFLPFPVLPYPLLSFSILAYRFLSFPILPSPLLFYHVLSIFSYPFSSFLHHFLPFRSFLSCPILFYAILYFPILSCFYNPFVAFVSFPIFPYPLLTYLVLPTRFSVIVPVLRIVLRFCFFRNDIHMSRSSEEGRRASDTRFAGHAAQPLRIEPSRAVA